MAFPILELPAELRHEIYELTFASNSDYVDLFDKTQRPSNALARTCRQVHAETKLMYRRVCEEFWTQSDFFIKLPEQTDFEREYEHTGLVRAELYCIGDSKLSKIRHLRVFVGDQNDPHTQWRAEIHIMPKKMSWYRYIWDTSDRTIRHDVVEISRREPESSVIMRLVATEVERKEEAMQWGAGTDGSLPSSRGEMVSLKDQVIWL